MVPFQYIDFRTCTLIFNFTFLLKHLLFVPMNFITDKTGELRSVLSTFPLLDRHL